MNKLAELVKDSHARALRKGWWAPAVDPVEFDDQIAEKLALVHSELSEALECYRDGEMETFSGPPHDSTAKPEGFWVEIADAVIRAADLAGRLGREFPETVTGPVPAYPIPTVIADMHACVSSAYNLAAVGAVSGAMEELSLLLDFAFEHAAQHGVDLWEVITLKAAYNETRPYRHANAALPGGKVC